MIEVGEEGTVAAAATAVIMVAPIIITTVPAAADESASEERPPVDFVANLPFIFFLRDLQTGLLLFHGRLVNPSGENSTANKEPGKALSTEKKGKKKRSWRQKEEQATKADRSTFWQNSEIQLNHIHMWVESR